MPDENAQNPHHWHVAQGKHGGWAVVRQSFDGGHSAVHQRTRQAAEELLASWGANGRCLECGDVLKANYVAPYCVEIVARKLCFSCLHWATYAADPGPDRVVVDGRHYTIEPERKGGPSRLNGFAGARWHIRFHSGREVVTHNLWLQGVVPPHFRDRLPDNAEFVREPRPVRGFICAEEESDD